MSEETLIAKGKVATITADTQIAINVGANQGVRADDVVTLYRDVDVKDPDSGELLGSLQYPRLRLKVLLVFPTYSVAAVTDRASSETEGMRLAARIRPLKRLTSQPMAANGNSIVLVKVGEFAKVTRPVPDEEDEA